jgi:hypothetical protein
MSSHFERRVTDHVSMFIIIIIINRWITVGKHFEFYFYVILTYMLSLCVLHLCWLCNGLL